LGRRVPRLPAQTPTVNGVAAPLSHADVTWDEVISRLREQGYLIIAPGPRQPQRQGLVYVAGFAPQRGESALQLINRLLGSTLAETLVSFSLPGGNDLCIGQDRFRRGSRPTAPRRGRR
jgi:hypothetical protein